MLAASSQIAVCLALTRAMGHTRTVEDIYAAALDALDQGLDVSRASVLLFDPDGVMRFKAYRGLSDAYRRAVEGHTPWTPDSPDPQPIIVSDVGSDPSLLPYLPVIRAEGIAAMAFVPLVSMGRVIGKFMLYFAERRVLGADELQLAGVIAAQVAFALERMRAEAQARRSEERLRSALDAAMMGTWDWDLVTQEVRWSDNLERVHGLLPGTFDGTFASYAREIHPDDRARVFASARRAIEEGVPHEVEYRIVAPDGTVRWVEGKGRVEYENGKPVRMSGVCMITTRRKEAELARLAAAEEASRLKDEFLATLSHELRTPLNAILGWVQILKANGVPADRSRHALDVIGRNATLQAQLIEDILDVSRIIAGKLEIERRPLLVGPLVEAAIHAVLPAASARGLRVTREIAPLLPPIDGDPKRLQQVLNNILSNAVKFTERGEIHVRCAAAGNAVSIEVRDSGDGIAPEFLPYVFDRFRQADSRSTRKHGGLGLGLAIARHLIEEHRGRIEVRSDGPGLGTTFSIVLPAGVADRSPTDRLPAGRPAHAAVEPRLDGFTVLVVDDERDSRDLVATLLDSRGASVIGCASVAAALDAIGRTAPRLVIADIAMPEVDGYELMARLRRMNSGIPAIAVSAYVRPEDRDRAMAAGFRAYCPKPLDAPAFLRVVGEVIRTG